MAPLLETVARRAARSPIGTIAAMSIGLTACSPPAHADVYYVDFASGSDSASGTEPGKAWKRAPGDPEATGAASKVGLRPGDTVRFRGGVSYRGIINLPSDGTVDAPITYAGDQWGSSPAVFDGAEPASSVTPCPSAEACGGAVNWTKLSLVSFTVPATQLIKLFDDSGMLFESQYPNAKEPFFSDNVLEYAETPVGNVADIESGRLKSPALASALAGGATGAQLTIWTYGNQVTRRTITAINGDLIEFPANGLKLYKNRPGRAAVVNAVGLINQPGLYAAISPGQAVAWLRDQSPIRVGSGRRAIDIRGKSDVVIRGFVFERFVAGKYGEGVQIFNSGPQSTRAVIEHNTFRRSALFSGAGAIMIGKVDDARISENSFADLERGSGIRTNLKPVNRLHIVGNSFRRLGRTGILVMGSNDVVISKNVMEGLYGIHGNGISLYLDNRKVTVSDNRVINASRPLTFHGEDDHGKNPGDHQLLIERNVFSTSEPSAGAITSYGKARGVTIVDNILIGPKVGLLLSARDSRVVATGNRTSGVATKGQQPSDWIIKDNKGVSRAEAKAALPPPDS